VKAISTFSAAKKISTYQLCTICYEHVNKYAISLKTNNQKLAGCVHNCNPNVESGITKQSAREFCTYQHHIIPFIFFFLFKKRENIIIRLGRKRWFLKTAQQRIFFVAACFLLVGCSFLKTE
jgi:hypothetical protein